jgi:ribonucleoside-diphosphate reductase alpha chain
MSNASVTSDAQVVSINKTLLSSKDIVSREAGHWPRVFTSEGIHPFDQIEWKIVDACIRSGKGEIIFEQKDIEVPAWWTQNNVNVVADKYFRVVGGVRENSVKQIFTRVCSTIRDWASDQKFFNTVQDKQVFEEELIYALLHQYGAFNSPVWFNLGIDGREQTASACFISGIEDSLDDIMHFQASELAIFRGGSGSGANLSNLRSSYEKISAGSYTSGPMSWMQGNNAYAGSMKSGGATRNAAKMVVMDMDHPDILETRDGRPGFISCKSWAEKLAHDLVSIGYSSEYDNPNGAYKIVPYQNANHSVSVPDAFMQSMLDDGTWQTRERKGGKIVHNYNARMLWHEIADAAWKCGDPGIQFSDNINKWHTTPKSGRIRASNPCAEFLHIDNTACNLCAINLTKFFDGRKFVADRFIQATRIFSTSQMAIIAKASYPTDEITSNSHKLRPIGSNYGDLGALIMNLGYGYDSDEGRAIAARMASLMTGVVYLTSSKMAARIGTFSEYEKNRDDMLRVMRMHQEADTKITERWHLSKDPISDDIASLSADIWRESISLGEKYGYNVSQATLQAPLGTISFLMGMNTTGIEPAFSLVSYKSLVGGGVMKLVNFGVREALVNLGYSKDEVDEICKYVESHDTIDGAPGLKDEHLPVFDTAMPSGDSGRYLSPMAHIKMMAAIQPLITCAMSKTVNLPEGVTSDEIAKIYEESWRLGLKCIALYRDKCKASQPLVTKEAKDPVIQAALKEAEVRIQEVIREVPVVYREKMPSDVKSWRHKFEIDGYKGYLIVSEYPDGRPGEIFLKLGKPGSTVSGLIDGFTQLCSIAIQYGIPLPKLIISFIDTRFEPSGITTNKNVRFAKSLYDYMFKVLDVHYYGGEYSGLTRTVDDSHEDINESISKDPDSDVFRSIIPSPSSAIPIKPARKNLGGPPCTRCGNMTQRNGSCYLCSSCGTTTGCS